MKPKLSPFFLASCVVCRVSFVLFLLALRPLPSALGQVPQGFNYQAVARDAISGNPITEPVNVKIAILAADASTIIYGEEHSSVDPDEHGLFNLVVGQGTWESGVAGFSDIDWSEGPKYIRTSIYYGGGWKVLDPAQLWSVPYAMVADSLGGPLKRLEVKGETEDMEESLFEVRNTDGKIVFAVYNEGVRIYVSDGDVKGPKGGFAIGGFGTVKQEDDHQYFFVSGDSIRAYIDSTSVKGVKGGFAIGGFDYTKGKPQDYMKVTRDSVRIYLDANPATKGPKGGFAIGGFDFNKSMSKDYFNISSKDEAEIIDNESRIVWYPNKDAFLAGTVHIGSPDSVGRNSAAIGYENIAMGQYSQALGYRSQTLGSYSFAMGYYAKCKYWSSVAIGYKAAADSTYAYAFGDEAKASGYKSYALGYLCTASGGKAYAIGSQNRASGDVSYAIGHSADATENSAMAIGRNAQAAGYHSVAIGVSDDLPSDGSIWTTASGSKSVAIGTAVKTSASPSYGFGYELINDQSYSVVLGRYNEAAANSIFILGNGTSDGSRFNALCLLKNNKLGLSVNDPQSRLEVGNIVQTPSLTNIMQNVTYSSINVSSSYTADNYIPGIIWRTIDNNGTKPKAGIWGYNDASGSKLFFGTSNAYATGITNTALVIDEDGNVGIGTSTPDQKFVVNNGTTIGRYTTGGWTHSSDIRLKSDITNISGVLKDVMNLQGVRFRFVNDDNNSPQIGFVAQDVENIFPEFVVTDEDGYKSIAYGQISAVLVEALKEQQKHIESQQAQIDELKELISRMEEKIASSSR